jgi:hypothetical protein
MQEPPNERPFINVIPITRRRMQMDQAKQSHPSGVTATVSGPISNITVNGVPIEVAVTEDGVARMYDDVVANHPQQPSVMLHTPNVDRADAQLALHLNPPPFERVMAASAEFPRVSGRKMKSSGCWYCEGQHSSPEPFCDVCVYMLADYIRWLEAD